MPATMPALQEELKAARQAVTLASRLCRSVQMTLGSAEHQDKPDDSPVTVADYGAQAVVAWTLKEAFPGTPLSLIAEEDADDLSGAAMLDRITALVNETLGLARQLAPAQVADLIDAGGSPGGRTGRHWVLDPIDGTRGFVGRRQYAVCLGLIEGEEVTLGVLGCPNLPQAAPVGQASLDAEAAGRDARLAPRDSGCLFHAVKGQGAWVCGLAGGEVPARISAQTDPEGSAAVYMTSWESRHSNHDLTDRLAAAVGVSRPALKLDSQAKYGLLARGDASIFLRMPAPGYKEKVWDHAAGAVLVTEAGGCISDCHGRPLDFGAGRFLEGLQGGIIAAAPPTLHAALVRAYTEAAAVDA
ncbi:hypothetical protein APUTEX25_004198 [Auxenochlorella protothecoides]|uniref:3'(2'),5'-bisphosphate nucleotidase n=1 Tax=Auxenochlorella protothecoides TaxID=3075 RepID=A0A3M7L5I9_AUXPR|nr:hypothetical protein APUTEX25_004198 [Auxenochlorella protothecoides]|eukprot:RMZ57364.1 hypothetical protein APUTEX25_004198 [Auxenochlorella protothecoides]